MSAHVATGVLALVFALLHGGMLFTDTLGGHTLLALLLLVITGTIGRYLYSHVPHAANGRELVLEEVRDQLAVLSAEWDRQESDLGVRVREEIEALVAESHWKGSLWKRTKSLLSTRRKMGRVFARLVAEAREADLGEDQLASLLALTRQARRTALLAAHFEDLRALLSSWRYLHRWIALLMALLLFAHVIEAIRYGGLIE